mmetsp:Transcript_26722/g.36741  ORF Transcript_26722/g.36741 Transcript_26722/m.36741 type:complete len:512 (+) Transcript_26722:78-1613(+)
MKRPRHSGKYDSAPRSPKGSQKSFLGTCSLDDVENISSTANFTQSADAIPPKEKENNQPHKPLIPSVASLDDVEFLKQSQSPKENYMYREFEKPKSKESDVPAHAPFNLHYYLKCKRDLEQEIEELKRIYKKEIASKDKYIHELKHELVERNNQSSNDVIAATKKQVEHVEALKAKDLQIQNLQQLLFTKTSEYVAEKKVAQEATAVARETKLGYSRLENDFKKLQAKHEELVKEKALRRSFDSCSKDSTKHGDGECAIYVEKFVHSTDISDEDGAHLSSADNHRNKDSHHHRHRHHRHRPETGHFRKDKLLNSSSKGSSSPLKDTTTVSTVVLPQAQQPEQQQLIVNNMVKVSSPGDIDQLIVSTMSTNFNDSIDSNANKKAYIRSICERNNIMTTILFEGEVMSKKFSSDFMFKNSWFWVDPITFSVHWVKAESEIGNRAVSKFLMSKKSRVPLERHCRLGTKKGIIRSVGKFPGSTGIFISTDNEEYLEIRGTAHSLDNWLKVLKIIV